MDDLFSIAVAGSGQMPGPFFVVYKITNIITRAAYIGITRKGIEARFAMHWKASKREDSVLYRAMRKYGRAAFTIEVLVHAQHPDHLGALERRLIKKHKTFVRLGGYNMTLGGEGSPEICDEIRENMRRAAAARMLDPTIKARISAKLKGRPAHPNSLVASLRNAENRRGKPLPEQHRKNAADRRRGIPVTAEQRAKISKTLTGKKLTPEHCEAVSKAMMGRVVSAETRAKISASHRRTETKAKTSAAMKAMWAGPDGEKRREINRKSWDGPNRAARIASVVASNERRFARRRACSDGYPGGEPEG